MQFVWYAIRKGQVQTLKQVPKAKSRIYYIIVYIQDHAFIDKWLGWQGAMKDIQTPQSHGNNWPLVRMGKAFEFNQTCQITSS